MAKQKDGRYRAKITVGHTEDGKPVVKYASGRTKKELEANKEELRRTYIAGQCRVPRNALFGPYAAEWYAAYKKPNLSKSSRNTYASVFNVHILPEFANRQLRAITAADLQLFLNSKAGMSVSSLGYMHSILRSVFQRAYADGVIDRDPTVGLQKLPAKKESRRALTAQERAAALAVGAEHKDGILLLLLYYTGMRVGEVLGLQWRDIDFTEKMIHVRRDMDFKAGELGNLKSGCSRRDIPMPEPLRDALMAIRGVGSTAVIQSQQTHTHLPESTYRRMWARLMRAMYAYDTSIESADGKSVLTAHYFRHNYATMLYDADVDILSAQRFLGHADAKTTLSIYAHLSQGKEDKNAAKVRGIFEKLPESCQKGPVVGSTE